MSHEGDKEACQDPLSGLYWRDEVLQVMYWMTGEGFGREFATADLQRFLNAEEAVLNEILGRMTADGLLGRAGDRYALTASGRKEGGRRFADEFGEMVKPGHFECATPDCGCHDPAATAEVCKHMSPAHSPHTRS